MLLFTQPAFVRLQAQRSGSHGGLVYRERRLSFGEVADAIDRLSAWLTRAGCGRGDRIVVAMSNAPCLPIAMYAAWSVGAVAVPISARSSSDEVAHFLAHSQPRAIICDEGREPLVRGISMPAVVCDDFGTSPRWLRRPTGATPKPPREPRAEDLAVIAYTSGTTGKPKGAMLTHANLHWATLACAAARGDTSASVGACISPLSHTPVFVSHLLCRIALGQTAVLLEKFDVEAILAAIERHRITDVSLIAGMVFDIVKLKRIAERRRRSVRKVTVGGAATPMAAKQQLGEIFAGAEIIEAYGQSESTDGVCMARGTSVFDRPGTVGSTNPYLAVKVRRSDGNFAAVDEEGELIIGGPTVMRGYYRDRAATAAQIRDSWLHTGDLGRQDSDGYAYITGRVKQLIITGGENVSPVEIEEVLRRHPHVADVAVIGTPHERWGEQVTAVVVAKRGAPQVGADLTEFAGRYLAGFKKPRRVEFVASLPRNAANKVQTGLLKEMLAEKKEA